MTVDSAAIRAEGLTKDYGRGHGVFDLDLAVREGEIFGYLGPNGAGKTTTIRLLLDLIRPTRGRAELLGLDVRRDSVELRRRLGYVPGDLSLYDGLTGRELVNYFASLRGGAGRREADALAARLELDLARQIRQLSKGNRQKVGLVQALMHRPDLLVLDEPTAGLDPLAQEAVHELLREAAADGRTVFLSSHLLAEVERIAHRVGILREGRLVVVEEVGALKARAVRHLEFQFAGPVPDSAFAGLPGVRSARADGAWVRLEVEGEVDAAVKAAAAYEVVNVTSHEPDLEEIFLAYYRDGAEG
jgi:ABC-2 type transport system ATP-binding protein